MNKEQYKYPRLAAEIGDISYLMHAPGALVYVKKSASGANRIPLVLSQALAELADVSPDTYQILIQITTSHEYECSIRDSVDLYKGIAAALEGRPILLKMTSDCDRDNTLGDSIVLTMFFWESP